MNPTPHLWALIGNPNAGKTALFNALTGSRQKVANYPGVTVEKKEGLVYLPGQHLRVLDLPGTYSLDAKTPDEEISKKVILGQLGERPQGLLLVVDACHLERSLVFALELKELGYPIVIAMNMMDLASRRGLKVNVSALASELGLPIVATVATKRLGLEPLLQEISKHLHHGSTLKEWHASSGDEVRNRYDHVDSILSRVVTRKVGPPMVTEWIDRLVLHPIGGFVFLGVLLFLLFQALFSWAEMPMEWVESGVLWLGQQSAYYLPDGILKSLWSDGIVSGVGAVLVFLPQIMILFFFILLLEDTGYMARAAFLMDRLMGRVGLHGRAFVPLLSGHACAIPAIMATRTIENPRHRLLTIVMIPLTTCSARLPVYALLIAAFIPQRQVGGWFNLQGLVMMGLYLSGILAALSVGFFFRKTFLKGPNPYLLMELPTYKLPTFRNIALGLWERARLFLKRAGTLIMALSIILWFLSSFPRPPADATEPPIHYSLAGRLGHAIEPLVRPLGFDWKIATSLIPAFAAREVMVSSLATVYALSKTNDGSSVEEALSAIIAKSWSLATGLSLMVWYIFAPQCLATFAVIRRETHGMKWAWIIFFFNLGLAYLASALVYQLCLFWGVA